MSPVLQFGGLTLHTYGLLLAAALWVGVLVGVLRGVRFGIASQRMYGVALYGVFAGVIGGKLLGFLLAYDHQRELWPQFVRMARSAGAVQGGLIAGVIVSVLYLRRHRVPIWRAADAVAPGLALAQAVGRTGCFLAGCCYGVPTDVPWAITFTNPLARDLIGTPLHVPLHPTQLYEVGATLLIGVVLLATENRGRYFAGRTFWLYALMYSVARFAIEFYRPSTAAGISAGQIISLGVGALSIVMLIRLGRRSRDQRRELPRPRVLAAKPGL